MRKYIAEEKGQKRSCGNALRKKVEKIKREWIFDLSGLFYRSEDCWKFGLKTLI